MDSLIDSKHRIYLNMSRLLFKKLQALKKNIYHITLSFYSRNIYLYCNLFDFIIYLHFNYNLSVM